MSHNSLESLVWDPDDLFIDEDVDVENFNKFDFPHLRKLHTALPIVVDFQKIPMLQFAIISGKVSFKSHEKNQFREIEWREKNCTNWSSEFTKHLRQMHLDVDLNEEQFILPLVLDCLAQPGCTLKLDINYDITELQMQVDDEKLFIIDCDLEDEAEDDDEVH